MSAVLVVGALHHDVIVDTPALPRVDETLPGNSVRYAFGGKGGNQAVQAGRLGRTFGVNVAMAGCVGRDAPGDLMLQTLGDAALDCTQIQRVDAPTGMSVALSLPDGGYGAVIVSSANLMLDPDRVVVPPITSWVVLQNEVREQVNSIIAQAAKRCGARVLLNAAPARPVSDTLLQLVDLLVVNRVEAADMLESGEDALASVSACQALRLQVGADVIITLGGEGWLMATADGVSSHAAHTVNVISTHGAGDAYIGALAVKLASGAMLEEAAHFASAAAALHVSTPVERRRSISPDAIEALAQTATQTASL